MSITFYSVLQQLVDGRIKIEVTVGEQLSETILLYGVMALEENGTPLSIHTWNIIPTDISQEAVHL